MAKEREKLAGARRGARRTRRQARPAPRLRRGPAGRVSGAGGSGWAAYLESLACLRHAARGWSAWSALLERLGRPQDAYRVVHIVGTNGKSSTRGAARRCRAPRGGRSGAYLSPHVSGWSERVLGRRTADEGRRVRRRREPSRNEVAGCRTEAARPPSSRRSPSPRWGFPRAGVDALALEAGLGGGWTPPTCPQAAVGVLTNIALEHTEVLGDAREADLRREGGRHQGR